MAYPPTLPPGGRTDATAAAGAHAKDHNDAAAALAAIVAELGIDPSGTFADVTARLADAATKSTANAQAIAANATAVAGNTTAIAGNSAAITQLQGSAALKEELSASVLVSALNDPPTAYISANTVQTIFVPPYPLQITSIAFSWEYYNLTTSDTNYWTISVQKRTGTTGTSFVSKNTMVLGEGITARKPWRLDGSSWNLTNNQLGLGDTLALNIFMTGAPTPMRLPMVVSFRWLPL